MGTYRASLRDDRWVLAAVVWTGIALVVGVISTFVGENAGSPALWPILVSGVVALPFGVRASNLAVLVAAVLVALELRDPAPWGTWAVAGALLFLYALRRPRFDAVAAGVVVAASALLISYEPWSEASSGGAFSLVTLAVAAVGVGQWVQAQRRYVIAEVGRRRQEAERRREEVARHVAEERVRIARELHDSVAHHLAVVSVHTNVARANLLRSPPAAEQALKDVQLATQSVLDELGMVLSVLRGTESEVAPPGPFDESAVDELLQSFRGIGLRVTTAGLDHLTGLAPVARTAARRLLQESLTNAQRYGNGEASVTVAAPSQGYVTISIRNTRAHEVAAYAGSGLGILGMEERVTLLGGAFQAGPEGDDFLVSAQLPVMASHPAKESSA